MSGNDFTDKRFDEALARGAELRRRILAQLEMLTVDEFRQRIKEANAECPPGTLCVLALPVDAGKRRFPAWQINLSGPRSYACGIGEH